MTTQSGIKAAGAASDIAIAPPAQTTANRAPDLVLYGGKITTGDPTDPAPTLHFDDQLNSSRHFMRELNRFGVTSVSDAGGGGQNYPDDYAASNDSTRMDTSR